MHQTESWFNGHRDGLSLVVNIICMYTCVAIYSMDMDEAKHLKKVALFIEKSLKLLEFVNPSEK